MKVTPKETHIAVNYRRETPHTDKRCSNCSMYVERGPGQKGTPHCTAVEDPIYPNGYCGLWEERT